MEGSKRVRKIVQKSFIRQYWSCMLPCVLDELLAHANGGVVQQFVLQFVHRNSLVILYIAFPPFPHLMK